MRLSLTLGFSKIMSGMLRASRPVRANVGVVPMVALYDWLYDHTAHPAQVAQCRGKSCPMTLMRDLMFLTCASQAPLPCGLYDVVVVCLVLSAAIKPRHALLQKDEPLSLCMRPGMPLC